MLKFLVDVGVGRKVEDWLAQNGYDVKSVRHLNPRMPDVDILALATSEKRIVITMDKDFGELVYYSQAEHTGVLLLRLEDATSSEKVQVVSEIMTKYGEELYGKFSVYQNNRLRIRAQ